MSNDGRTASGEDELCCAWIGGALVEAGYKVSDDAASEAIDRWAGQPVETIRESPRAEVLRSTGQDEDLEFVLAHIDDLDPVFVLDVHEVKAAAG